MLASLKRYGKETKLLKEMEKLPSAAIAFGNYVEANYLHLLEHGFPTGMVESVLTNIRLQSAAAPGTRTVRKRPARRP